jgi:aclacinomycin oxidase
MEVQSLTDRQRIKRAESKNIGPDDPRYSELTRRGFNKRFDGKPDYVRLVGSTVDVIDAVQSAVRAGLRLAVRSGGHCLEGFVAIRPFA